MALDFAERIDAIDWSTFATAYGPATDVGAQLKRLASGHHATAMTATHDLWCGLCHQHAYISSAALPAFPFLLEFLDTADAEFTTEILDIFVGFATCSTLEDGSPSPLEWQRQLREHLVGELPRFIALTNHNDEEVSGFAEMLVENLTPNDG